MKLNVLVPMAGESTFRTSNNSVFPKLLAQINGKLLVERAASPLISLPFEKKIVVVVPEEQVKQYQLDRVLELLDETVSVYPIPQNTKGAPCSALLSIEQLDLDQPLVLTSFDQVLDLELGQYINEFINQNVDVGVLTFNDIHPKWSYVKTSNGSITQAAEKVPISREAIAGLYYFRTGHDFVEATKNMIRKDVKHNELFFISHTLNELILLGKKAVAIPIQKERYFHFHVEHSIETFEEIVMANEKAINQSIHDKTQQYIKAFDNKDIAAVSKFFTDGFNLIDPSVNLVGKDKVCAYISSIFEACENLSFVAKSIVTERNKSVIEFELQIDDAHIIGTDVIEWNDFNEMTSMRAYLYAIEDER